MTLTTFSPPLKGTALTDSLPRIIIAAGMSADGSVPPFLMVVDMHGVIELLGISKITVDWRYDPDTELWGDPTTGSTEDPLGDEEG